MKKLLWIAAIVVTALTACNYDEGACWIDGQGGGDVGAGGGPIVPGAGGYGDAPPPEPEPQDAEPQGGCKDDEWSDKPACSRQHAEDRVICRRVKRERCWSSAMDRLAYCNKTGKTGFPDLDY